MEPTQQHKGNCDWINGFNLNWAFWFQSHRLHVCSFVGQASTCCAFSMVLTVVYGHKFQSQISKCYFKGFRCVSPLQTNITIDINHIVLECLNGGIHWKRTQFSRFKHPPVFLNICKPVVFVSESGCFCSEYGIYRAMQNHTRTTKLICLYPVFSFCFVSASHKEGSTQTGSLRIQHQCVQNSNPSWTLVQLVSKLKDTIFGGCFF